MQKLPLCPYLACLNVWKSQAGRIDTVLSLLTVMPVLLAAQLIEINSRDMLDQDNPSHVTVS